MKFENIKKSRKERNLKQKDIATILNVDRSTYSGWETGKDTIPLRKLFDLSNFYNLSIDYLTGLSKKNDYIYTSDFIDLKSVGENLKKLRINNHLKQKDLFNMLNITSSSYSLYENGKILIQTSFIYQIAKKYKISIDSILKEQ